VISKAGLLLLDEPTAQLDRRNADRVIDLLRRAAENGQAVMCATHDADLTDRAQRVTHLG
jgi:ABC-type lipoprotein export system ATPase subunit